MNLVFLFGGIIDIIIAIYSYYFLTKVRYYPCIFAKMGKDIHLWSWIVVLCGVLCCFMPYYSFRAILYGFDCTTILMTIPQFLVWIYGALLFNFHIKTTRYEKRII